MFCLLKQSARLLLSFLTYQFVYYCCAANFITNFIANYRSKFVCWLKRFKFGLLLLLSALFITNIHVTIYCISYYPMYYCTVCKMSNVNDPIPNNRCNYNAKRFKIGLMFSFECRDHEWKLKYYVNSCFLLVWKNHSWLAAQRIQIIMIKLSTYFNLYININAHYLRVRW